jgi:predicted Zn-dependent protease
MYIHASLLKTKLCEQRSQYDAALKIYQCLLRLVPSHPQFNDLKGAMLIQMGRPAQAIQPLEIAWSHEHRDPQALAATGSDLLSQWACSASKAVIGGRTRHGH